MRWAKIARHFPKDHKTTKVVSPREMMELLTPKK